jgi:hypothetical protein
MHFWLTSAHADFESDPSIQNTQISRAATLFSLPRAPREPFCALQTHLSCTGQQMSVGRSLRAAICLTDVRFRAEVMLIPLLGLVHLRVTLLCALFWLT